LSQIVGCCVIAALLTAPETPFAAAQQARRNATAPSGGDWAALVEELQEEVEELRGWKFKHPVETGVCSEKRLREFIQKKAFEEEYGPDGLLRAQAFLRMVGLIPADCDLRQTILDVLLNQIGGFYDPTAKVLYVLDRSDIDYGPLLSRIIVAHELTHTLDDQYVDLDRLIKSRERTEDWSLTVGSVVEGSATALMMRYTLKAMNSGQYDPVQLIQLVRQEQERSRTFLEAPPYFSSLATMYMCGMSFLQGGASGPAVPENVGQKLLQAAENPPVSTEQILHPEKYWNKAKRDYPVEVDEADVERLLRPLGLHVVHKDTVGELLCALLTTDENRVLDMIMVSLPSYWTNEAATGWGGDRFFLLAEGKDAQAAKKNLKGLRGVWITLWDTAVDRREFVEDYALERELPARWAFELGDRGTVYLFGFDPAQREALQRRFERAPPAFRKDGKPWTATK